VIETLVSTVTVAPRELAGCIAGGPPGVVSALAAAGIAIAATSAPTATSPARRRKPMFPTM
jgi:hypothetical protein